MNNKNKKFHSKRIVALIGVILLALMYLLTLVFALLDNPATMQQIQDLMVAGNPALQPDMVRGCMRGAPVMTFIARDLGYDFSAYDCGLLAGNMMLAAQSLGVGTICLGSPVRFINDAENSAEILSILGFCENYELCLCVGLGYANEAPAAKPRDINKVQFVD